MGSAIAYASPYIATLGHLVRLINESFPWIPSSTLRPTRCAAGSLIFASSADACVAVHRRRVVYKLPRVHSLLETVCTSRPPFGVLRAPHRLPNFPSFIASSGYVILFLVLFFGFSRIFNLFRPISGSPVRYRTPIFRLLRVLDSEANRATFALPHYELLRELSSFYCRPATGCVQSTQVTILHL